MTGYPPSDEFTLIRRPAAAPRAPASAPGWYATDRPDNKAILTLNLEFVKRLNLLRVRHEADPGLPESTRKVALDAVRRAGTLPALELEVLCSGLASVVVEDNARMLANTPGAINHKDSLGRWPHDRLLLFDHTRTWDSEVLSAGGSGSVLDPLEGWILSPGHREVILHPKARRCGLWMNVQAEPKSPYRWFDGSLRRWGCVFTS